MKDLIVQTRNGQVRGVIRRSIEGFGYCAFLGIPYAKPPVDDLRFKVSELQFQLTAGIHKHSKLEL